MAIGLRYYSIRMKLNDVIKNNDVEQVVISEANKRLNDAIEPLANTINEPNEELVNLLTKIANGDELSPEEFFFIDKNGKRKPIIESFLA